MILPAPFSGTGLFLYLLKADMDGEREIIYLAISNLILNCADSLERSKKLPPEHQSKEEIEMLENILQRALVIEDKMRQEVENIDRPNWGDL